MLKTVQRAARPLYAGEPPALRLVPLYGVTVIVTVLASLNGGFALSVAVKVTV